MPNAEKKLAMSSELKVIDPTTHDRSKLIGGADIAAVIGCSPWKTRLDLWSDKIKPRVEGAIARRDPKARGIRWESVVAEMLVERLQDDGHDVEIVASNLRYRDAEHPFLAAEIDFELRIDGADEITNCELKTVHPFKLRDWGDSGTDELPTHYTAQVMHGLGVTRRRSGMLAALFGADELRVYPVPADDGVIGFLRQRAVEFWTDYVLAGIPPEPQRESDLMKLWPRELDGGPPLLADEDLVSKLLRMRAIDREIDARQGELDALRFEVQRAMRDAPAIVLPNGKTACDWKHREGKAIDHEAVKAALGTKGYAAAHKPWQARIFSLKSFAIDGL